MNVQDALMIHAAACMCEDCTDWLHSHHVQYNQTLDTCAGCVGGPFGPVVMRKERCYKCGTEQELTGRTKVIDRQDPTVAEELTCGHFII